MPVEKELTGYPSIDKPWLKYYSEEALNTDIPKMTMYQYIFEKNRNNMSSFAFQYFNKNIKNADFFKKIKKVAALLEEMDIKKGDIVTIMSMHTPEAIITMYALNYIGAIANMVYMTLSEKETVEIIHNTNSKAFFALDIVMDKVSLIAKEINIPIIIFAIEDSMPSYLKAAVKVKNGRKKHSFLSFESFISKKAIIEPSICTDSKATAVIVYTSGTTGEPKGVMLSNDNINAIAFQCSLTDKNYKRGETYLACIPLFLGFGISMIHLGISEGLISQLILNPDLDYIIKKFIKLKSNRLVYGPRVVDYMIRNVTGNLEHLIDFTGGGEAISIEKEKQINEFLKSKNANARYTTGYGMTESVSVVTLNTNIIYKLGSVGVPFALSNVKVVEDGKEKKYEEEGEICLCSPSIMSGYYKNNEATKEVLEIDEKGQKWLYTGDLGYVDQDGFLFITGRIKRIYTTLGNDNYMYKLFPQRIEEHIVRLPMVNNCAVLVLDDEEKIHIAIAYVELKNDDFMQNVAVENIYNVLKEELPDHLIPKNIFVVSNIPLTTSGKIDYRKLKDMYNFTYEERN